MSLGHISPGGAITNLMPFLGSMPERLNPSIKVCRERREVEALAWHGYLDRVKQDISGAKHDLKQSWARAYLELKSQDSSDAAAKSFGFAADDEEATYAIGMLATVAIFTITAPLNTFFLAMALYPEWQDRVREEVDRVLGGRMATPRDSPALPTIRTAIKECIRWVPTLPLG